MDLPLMTDEQSLAQTKRCNCCGRFYQELPTEARPQRDFTERKIVGWFFECDCGSTMYVSLEVA